MAVALPFAFAAVGYGLGAAAGYATVGMTVGWLVGSWLFGPGAKGTGKGMKPQEMPSVNQALRGSPIFMTFGTNRISSQITWTKNYTATRHKGGGKGKSGGSGGTGSMKGGGSAGAYYTYSWDIMFNFGMMDQPAYIQSGWIGGDKLDELTLQSLLSGSASGAEFAAQFLVNILNGSDSVTEQTASLKFTESFFAPGFGSDSASLEFWQYFEDQEDVNSAWPNTAWLGLKTLDLGTSPFIPQLSLELGPTPAVLVPDGDGDGAVTTPSVSGGFGLPGGGYSILGLDGKHYAVADFGFAEELVKVVCKETETIPISIGQTDFNTDAAAELGTTGTYTPRFSIPAPGTPYFCVLGTKVHADGVSYLIAIVRYKIGIDGTASVDGGWHYRSLSVASSLHLAPIITRGMAGANVVGANLWGFAAMSGDSKTASVAFKLVLETDETSIATTGTWEARCSDVTDLPSAFLTTAITRNYYQRASIRQYGGFIGVFMYIPQAAIDTGGIYATWTVPTVLVAKIDVATTLPAVLTNVTTELSVDDWDVYTLSTGAVSTNENDDYSSPSMVGEYIVFCRSFSDNKGYARIRVYTLDPILSTFINLGAAYFKYDATPEATQDVNGIIVGDDGGDFYIAATYQRYIHFGSVFTISSVATDVTPPYIIYRILTSAVFGFNYPLTSINNESYQAAVDYCNDEGIVISVTYTTQDNLLSIIEELLALYGGFLTESGGIIKFGLARGDVDVPDPVVIDNSRLLIAKEGTPPVTITKGALQDGYNTVKMNFIDRAIDYKQNQIEVSDEVDVDLRGRRVREFPGSYVMAGSLAAKIAERALWTNMYGRDIYSFKLGAKDAHRQPGDVITIVDSFSSELSGGAVARITRIEEPERLQFDVQAVAVIDYQATAERDYTQTLSVYQDGLIQPIAPVSEFRMYELPKEFQGASAKFYVGYNQFSAVMGAQLHLSSDGTNYLIAQDAQPFVISGKTAADLPMRPVGYFERDVTLYLMPGSNFTVATPTYCQTHALDDISEANRAIGAGVLIVGSEAISMEGVNLVAQNRYRISRMYRGWGGTPISAHSSGAYWHYHTDGIFSQEISEDKIGTILHYKVVPYNFAGVLYNIASIDARTYQIKGLYWLPRIQPPITTYVHSAASWPRSVAIGETTHLKVVNNGCPVTLQWPDAANNEGFGAGGFGIEGFGHFAPDILTPAYRVDVYSVNGVGVSSFVVNTGHFDYTLDQNSTDFNGFAQNLWFEVTPYTIKGDGPISSSRTLELFW